MVDSQEGLESFRAQYMIPPGVAIRYCKEGQWHEERQEGEIVIPMIAFIEEGMRIPMGTITRDNLRAHRLDPTQCAPNMFRILGSVDALNERMDLNLTQHDVNWVYNLYHLKGQGYYLKTRHPKVKLISCLPESNNDMNKDFLIISGEWHDGLPCPMRDGKLGRNLGQGLLLENHPFNPTCSTKLPLAYVHACNLSSSVDLYSSFLFFLFFSFFIFLTMFALFSNGCTNNRAAIPNLNLVRLKQDIEDRGVRSHGWSTQSGPSNFGLHHNLV